MKKIEFARSLLFVSLTASVCSSCTLDQAMVSSYLGVSQVIKQSKQNSSGSQSQPTSAPAAAPAPDWFGGLLSSFIPHSGSPSSSGTSVSNSSNAPNSSSSDPLTGLVNSLLSASKPPVDSFPSLGNAQNSGAPPAPPVMPSPSASPNVVLPPQSPHPTMPTTPFTAEMNPGAQEALEAYMRKRRGDNSAQSNSSEQMMQSSEPSSSAPVDQKPTQDNPLQSLFGMFMQAPAPQTMTNQTVPASSSTANSAPQGLALGIPTLNSNEGWTLHQTSQLLGSQTAIMSAAGCKVSNPELDITYVVTAPDYRAAVYSPSRRVSFTTTYAGLIKARKQQKQSMDNIGTATGAVDTRYEPKLTGKIAGLNATQFVSQSTHQKLDRIGQSYDGSRSGATTTEMWFTLDIKVPLKFSEMACNCKATDSGLPKNGVLLRMVTTTDDGTKMVVLDTVSATKGAVASNEFQIPTGYKAVGSEYEVAYGADAGGALNGLFKQFANPQTGKDVDELFSEGNVLMDKLKESKQKWENAGNTGSAGR